MFSSHGLRKSKLIQTPKTSAIELFVTSRTSFLQLMWLTWRRSAYASFLEWSRWTNSDAIKYAYMLWAPANCSIEMVIHRTLGTELIKTRLLLCSVHHCLSRFLQEKRIWNVSFFPPVLNICFTKNLKPGSYVRGDVNSNKKRTT